MELVSIIIPVYNEERTILEILKKIYSLNLKKEIIVINDGSRDNSRRIILDYIENKKEFRLINKSNEGKGSAIKLGIKEAKGDIIAIQDADLEYNPSDLEFLIEFLIGFCCKIQPNL